MIFENDETRKLFDREKFTHNELQGMRMNQQIQSRMDYNLSYIIENGKIKTVEKRIVVTN